MRSLVKIEDPDEMPHNAAFHQGLHCLLLQKQSLVKEIHFLCENFNLWPLSIYNGPSEVYCIQPKGRIH